MTSYAPFVSTKRPGPIIRPATTLPTEPVTDWATRLSRLTRALSVRQPYASQIANGEKTIEFRSWATKHRGPLLICSGVSWAEGIDPAERVGPRGVTICVVDLVRCDGAAWDYEWILRDPVPVHPVEHNRLRIIRKGRETTFRAPLGVWIVPPELHRLIQPSGRYGI
jgi:hypothetical protein